MNQAVRRAIMFDNELPGARPYSEVPRQYDSLEPLSAYQHAKKAPAFDDLVVEDIPQEQWTKRVSISYNNDTWVEDPNPNYSDFDINDKKKLLDKPLKPSINPVPFNSTQPPARHLRSMSDWASPGQRKSMLKPNDKEERMSLRVRMLGTRPLHESLEKLMKLKHPDIWKEKAKLSIWSLSKNYSISELAKLTRHLKKQAEKLLLDRARRIMILLSTSSSASSSLNPYSTAAPSFTECRDIAFRSRPILVLTDIDDTLFASIHDHGFPLQTLYPGCLSFLTAIREGTRGMIPSTINPNNGPLSPRDAGTPQLFTADLVKQIMAEEQAAGFPVGNKAPLALLTARPTALVSLRALHNEGVEQIEIVGGSLHHLGSHKLMGIKKCENFMLFRQLYPEFRFVFIGDSGQADPSVALQMMHEAKQDVPLCFIHDVISSTHEALTPSSVRLEHRKSNLHYFDTYMNAANIAYDNGLISRKGLLVVAKVSVKQLQMIDWSKRQEGIKIARRGELSRAIATAAEIVAREDGVTPEDTEFNESSVNPLIGLYRTTDMGMF